MKTFKVGDRIKYICCKGTCKGDLWPYSDIGKTGTIIGIRGDIITVKLTGSNYTIGPSFTTHSSSLERIPTIGEQLLFDFMKKV